MNEPCPGWETKNGWRRDVPAWTPAAAPRGTIGRALRGQARRLRDYVQWLRVALDEEMAKRGKAASNGRRKYRHAIRVALWTARKYEAGDMNPVNSPAVVRWKR